MFKSFILLSSLAILGSAHCVGAGEDFTSQLENQLAVGRLAPVKSEKSSEQEGVGVEHQGRWPGFRKVDQVSLEENPFSPPKVHEESDDADLSRSLAKLLLGVVIDPSGGDSIRLRLEGISRFVRVGETFKFPRMVKRRSPVRNAPAITEEKMEELRLANVRNGYFSVRTLDGHVIHVPAYSSDSLTRNENGQSESEGQEDVPAFIDVMTGSALLVHPDGYLVASVPLDRDEKDLPSSKQNISCMTREGRFPLEFVEEDRASGIVVLRVIRPPYCRAAFPYAAMERRHPDEPRASMATRLVYDPDTRRQVLMKATATLPAKRRGDWCALRGSAPVGTVLWDVATGMVSGFGLPREGGAPGWASIFLASSLNAPLLRSSIANLATKKSVEPPSSLVEDVVVSLLKSVPLRESIPPPETSADIGLVRPAAAGGASITSRKAQ